MVEDLTLVVVLLDRSGSMYSLSEDVIGGYNNFIKDQKESIPGDALVTLAQFDHKYELIYANKPIKEVPLLNEKIYSPRGGTALLDSLGRLILDTNAALQGMEDCERPGRVIVMIFTDGAENSSKEFTNIKIKSLVKEYTEKNKWKFIFLGANIDSFAQGGLLGIQVNNTANYKGTSKGIGSAYYTISEDLKRLRSIDYNGYTIASANLNCDIDENSIEGTIFDKKGKEK